MRGDWRDWLVVGGMGMLAAALLYVAEPKGWPVGASPSITVAQQDR